MSTELVIKKLVEAAEAAIERLERAIKAGRDAIYQIEKTRKDERNNR